jgi:hypothetical protein
MSQSMTGETRGEGAMGEASARVHDAASLAQEKAQDLKEKGSSRLQSELDGRSSQLGTQLTGMARALRSSGSQLDSEGNAPATKLTEPAANQIDRLGHYLQRTSGEQLMDDVENLARQRPWLVAATGLFAGIAAARFVKASSDRRASGYRPAPRITTGYGQSATGTVGTIGYQPSSQPAYSAR